MSELKRCPLCGGEAFMYQTDPHESVFLNEKVIYKGATFIECAKCSCALSGPTKEYAIKAWNTRKPMERIIEQLEDRYDKLHEAYMDSRDLIDLGKKYGMEYAIEILKEEGGIE